MIGAVDQQEFQILAGQRRDAFLQIVDDRVLAARDHQLRHGNLLEK